MVLYDFSEQITKLRTFRFAPPHQRIISSFVDLLLLYPSAFFVVSPLIREMKEEFYFGTSMGFASFFFTAFLMVNLFVIGALTISTMFLGSTPGQRLFSLRVRSFNGERITFPQAMQRSFGWVLSIICLGLPLFEVLTHRNRLVFYERMSETFVETLEKKWSVLPPLPYEIAFGRWVLLSSFLLAVLIGFATWRDMIRFELQKAVLMATDRQMLCESLSTESLDREMRLNLALVVDYAFPEEKDCLNRELQSFWFKNDSRDSKKSSPAEAPEMQLSLHNFMVFESFSKSDYKEVCQEESQFCLLIEYLDMKRRTQNDLAKDNGDLKAIVEKLRLTSHRIPLVDFIILEEDIKATRFLPALSRLNELEKLVEGQSQELGLLLENRLVQLAWKAREFLEESGVERPQRRLASVGDGAEMREDRGSKSVGSESKEALQVLEVFKHRFGID